MEYINRWLSTSDMTEKTPVGFDIPKQTQANDRQMAGRSCGGIIITQFLVKHFKTIIF